MRRKWILMAVLIAAALMACKGDIEEPGGGANPVDAGAQEEMVLEESKSDSAVLEDEEAVYLCGVSQIRKMDKESREVTVLWQIDSAKLDMYAYAGGKALLNNGKIYFIEYDRRAAEGKETLSIIDTNGNSYEKIEEFERGVNAMYCSEQALYVYFTQGGMRAYEVGEDGGLTFSEALTENAPYKIPEGYSIIRGLTPFESVENYGYILLQNQNYKLVMIDPKTGKETVSGENDIEAMNRNYFLFSIYNEEEDCKELHLRDAQTLETKFLAKLERGNNSSVVGMDDDFAYLVQQKDGGRVGTNDLYDYNYERVALENGELSDFFTISAGTGVEYYTPYHVMDFTIRNGYIYYIADRDYAMYLLRRSIENPDEEEILGDSYFDKGIGNVGKIEEYCEEIHSRLKPEVILGEIALERLVVDEKYTGASEINHVLSDYQEDCISHEKSSVEWMEEELEKSGDDALETLMYYRYSSNPSGITYFDGDYFSFYQQEYDHSGLGRGMESWTGFTFDLETGERVGLIDLIGNSEEELKAIVTKYFAQYIGENPEVFREDALETVNEEISFDAGFYLSEEGIRFYFEPYVLSDYAALFQEVTIPYGEFDMKLPIGRKAVKADVDGLEGEGNEKGNETPMDMTTADHDVNGRKLPIYCVDTEEKKIALTFDAGWGNEDTEEILEILKKHDIHVTFFMTGGWVESYPDDVKAILAAGHDLGNHSESHKNMSQLSDEEKREEIMKVHEKVMELTGYDMFLFRPPYGDYDNAVVDILMDCGYYPIQWDVDSLDWQNKGVDSIIETVTEHKNLRNGSIVLCHNGAEYTAEALDTLINTLEAEGYEMVPLSELIYREDYHLNYEGRQIKN